VGVGHELRHTINGARAWSGRREKPSANFAHFGCHYAELSGTGCMPRDAVNVIDAALGNFYCIARLIARHAHLERTPLALRQREQAASGRAPTAAPVTCRLSLNPSLRA
jgi:hypothetical protein